jgi:hypothetical protein
MGQSALETSEGLDGWPAGSCPGECARDPIAPHAFSNAHDAALAIKGKWLDCGGAAVFSSDGLAGEELAPDGEWYGLRRDTKGALVRDPTWHGTWRIDKLFSDNAAYLAVAQDGGTLFRRAFLQDCPRNLWLDGSMLNAVP